MAAYDAQSSVDFGNFSATAAWRMAACNREFKLQIFGSIRSRRASERPSSYKLQCGYVRTYFTFSTLVVCTNTRNHVFCVRFRVNLRTRNAKYASKRRSFRRFSPTELHRSQFRRRRTIQAKTMREKFASRNRIRARLPSPPLPRQQNFLERSRLFIHVRACFPSTTLIPDACAHGFGLLLTCANFCANLSISVRQKSSRSRAKPLRREFLVPEFEKSSCFLFRLLLQWALKLYV